MPRATTSSEPQAHKQQALVRGEPPGHKIRNIATHDEAALVFMRSDFGWIRGINLAWV